MAGLRVLRNLGRLRLPTLAHTRCKTSRMCFSSINDGSGSSINPPTSDPPPVEQLTSPLSMDLLLHGRTRYIYNILYWRRKLYTSHAILNLLFLGSTRHATMYYFNFFHVVAVYIVYRHGWQHWDYWSNYSSANITDQLAHDNGSAVVGNNGRKWIAQVELQILFCVRAGVFVRSSSCG